MSRLFLFLMVLACAAATLGAAQGLEQRFTFDAQELVVANLVGKMHVEPADGQSFEVVVTVLGRDAGPGKVTFDKTDGQKARLVIRFPVEKNSHYVYPATEGDFSTTVEVPGGKGDGTGWLGLVLPGLRDRVRIASKGSGLQIWADVAVKMPRGKSLEIRHGVGAIESAGTTGGLILDSHYGPISVAGSDGKLSIDTGSGTVRVSDTTGDLAVDTGSGSVDLYRCRAKDLGVDTGSGSVRGAELECDAMMVDTGSGDVSILLTRMGSGDFVFDTGSGSVDLRIPSNTPARFEADTGSGSIDVKLPGVEIHRRSADDLEFRTGEGGARVRIDTGSGSIRVESSTI